MSYLISGEGDHALKKSNHRNLSIVLNKIEKLVPLDQLELLYESIVARRSGDPESQRTKTEEKVFQELRSYYKGQIFRSFWIGNRNVDFFLPSLRGDSALQSIKGFQGSRYFKGLVIEVDGSIHDRKFKMSKDNSKYQLLHKLDIGLLTIENRDMNSEVTLSMLRFIKNLKTVDSRQKRRVFRNVYIKTIASFYPDEIINEALSHEIFRLLKKAKKLI